ncbi:hypothetical protein ACE1SV_77080 [Streptomyces sennicomposti]
MTPGGATPSGHAGGRILHRAALGVRRATVGDCASGKIEPRPPQREAYARLLEQLYPTAENTAAPQTITPSLPPC